MPPKKELTKAQRRKLEEEHKKKEEEERKKIEDEKAAILKKKRDEEEMVRKAEEELFNAAEKERLVMEKNESSHYDLNLIKALQKQEDKFNQEQEWKRYLAKGDQANVADLRQVNDLMSVFKEISTRSLTRNR